MISGYLLTLSSFGWPLLILSDVVLEARSFNTISNICARTARGGK
jgi:hypothetical protein